MERNSYFDRISSYGCKWTPPVANQGVRLQSICLKFHGFKSLLFHIIILIFQIQYIACPVVCFWKIFKFALKYKQKIGADLEFLNIQVQVSTPIQFNTRCAFSTVPLLRHYTLRSSCEGILSSSSPQFLLPVRILHGRHRQIPTHLQCPLCREVLPP